MVTFDAALPGTDAAEWDAVIAAAPRLDLAPYDGLLVFAAHPDDETLGAGGLIADFARRSLPVRVVVVTDGRASHPRSTRRSPDDLARIRALEVRAALDILAPDAELVLLGYPDGATREHVETIAADVADLIDGTPASTLVAAPWRGDGHRDHRIIGESAACGLGGRTLLEYPVWMWHWAIPGDHELVTTTIEEDAKVAAIAAHVSQVHPLARGAGEEQVLDAHYLEHFARPVEAYLAPEGYLSPTVAMPPEYFDELYANRDDPWRLATRWYEERKRAITMAALPERRYASALEIGSSIGMLTAMLGDRCDSVLAVDVSEAAVLAARSRVGDNVTVERADVTHGLPPGTFDLIVLSEVGYYLSAPALELLVDAIAGRLGADGTLVACHWRHPVDGYLLSGDAVHAVIADHIGFAPVVRHTERDFVLEVYSGDQRSVAEREGLA